jgi:hypothetical protein
VRILNVRYEISLEFQLLPTKACVYKLVCLRLNLIALVLPERVTQFGNHKQFILLADRYKIELELPGILMV